MLDRFALAVTIIAGGSGMFMLSPARVMFFPERIFGSPDLSFWRLWMLALLALMAVYDLVAYAIRRRAAQQT